MLKDITNISVRQGGISNNSELEKTLIVSCLFSVCISIIRVIFTSQLMFVWLQWNLFLAIVPYLISRKLLFYRNKPLWKFLILAFIWLAFIPNSFYIITDLFYLEERPEMPFWFDLALLLSFVWNGVLLGVLSVRHMEKIFERRFGLKREWLFIIPVMGLNALGIFTGRYLRYNSWDILSNPFELVTDLLDLIIHPLRNRIDWSMILCYALLMMVIYSSLKRLGRAIS